MKLTPQVGWLKFKLKTNSDIGKLWYFKCDHDLKFLLFKSVHIINLVLYSRERVSKNTIMPLVFTFLHLRMREMLLIAKNDWLCQRQSNHFVVYHYWNIYIHEKFVLWRPALVLLSSKSRPQNECRSSLPIKIINVMARPLLFLDVLIERLKGK